MAKKQKKSKPEAEIEDHAGHARERQSHETDQTEEVLESEAETLYEPVVPTGKRGQPRKKPTREELEERINYAAHLLARRLIISDIKRILSKKYEVEHRVTENYLRAARKVIETWTEMPFREHKIRSLGFYESVLQDSRSTVAERMTAQGRIDRLLGLEAAIKLEVIRDETAEEMDEATLDRIARGAPAESS